MDTTTNAFFSIIGNFKDDTTGTLFQSDFDVYIAGEMEDDVTEDTTTTTKNLTAT